MRARALLVSVVLLSACDALKGPQEIKFDTVKAEKGRVAAKVSASGTVNALVTVQVGTQVSGRISDIYVDFNSPVKKGQLIARIDPRFFQAALDQTRANLEAAEGALAKAEVDAAEMKRRLERAEELALQQSMARNDAEMARAAAASAEATVRVQRGQVAQSRANVKQAEINLAYSTIYAPIDGIVISRNVDVGQTVAASFQAPVLFTIAQDLTKMQVETSVSESDIGRLKVGTEASFTVDAYPGQRFKGTVRQVRNAPINVQNVVTYTVVIDVANPELLLKPGMTATVAVVYSEKEGVLKVPNASLRFRPAPEVLARYAIDAGPTGRNPETARLAGKDKSPDKRTVWVLKDGVPTSVPIQTGITDGSFTEVVTGEINEGDTLITDVASKLGAPAGGSPGGANPMMRRVL